MIRIDGGARRKRKEKQMAMDDDWNLEDIPPAAGTPSYYEHPQYAELRTTVGRIRGEFVAHEYMNGVIAHQMMHLILKGRTCLTEAHFATLYEFENVYDSIERLHKDVRELKGIKP